MRSKMIILDGDAEQPPSFIKENVNTGIIKAVEAVMSN